MIISAFICAASFAREDQDNDRATFLESYADFLKANLESWTVTTKGSLVAGSWLLRALKSFEPRRGRQCRGGQRGGILTDQSAPGIPESYPARDIVDAGFLQLVRYGILSADNPLVVASLRAVDGTLKMDTASGPCWLGTTTTAMASGPRADLTSSGVRAALATTDR